MREMGINPETWDTKAEKSGAELTSRFFHTWTLTMKIRLLILSLLVSVPAFAGSRKLATSSFKSLAHRKVKRPTGDPFRLQPHRYAGDTQQKPYVFEAVGPVKYTPLKQWIPMVKRANTLFAALKAN